MATKVREIAKKEVYDRDTWRRTSSYIDPMLIGNKTKRRLREF